ncbi:pyruvate/2-oxoglutarate dehydrogenase complex dihydrolipoamide dehydrogenase (E3) component [Streptomyces sp. SLBN-118]|uniref:FAD/NAD(P)-dependent oxidoreductase n=1 Tax=Streptomyces sp. SLBN-118 TaxID=2768454 RepID=UPI001152085C|nr:NAD(P)/FAD-dependent oxidoreductase [Streptomyces sp. SLBN-118]TQK50537.1 pyruvate/2-oxoglutarate dehydrogenase complex dihydrolipoamide dehydrogenase (E3) component [Streptomyces sp. SLBN-118]
MPISASDPYDLAVIGAGSAGLAGAVTAAGLGLSVALLDASPQTGGQFYRHPARAIGAARPEALHHDWSAFAQLRRRLEQSDVSLLRGHHVWAVTKEEGALWAVHAVTGADGTAERSVRVRARAVLLATGAYERQLPFPGWTLPGVVGAGGAQAMLKSGLVLPGKRVVVAGSGPLLLAVASSLATAGAQVPAVIEASGYLGYARHPRALAANPRKWVEAAVHGAALLRHRVRVRLRSAVTEVHGTDRVEAVTVSRLDLDWRPVQGSGRRIECDALAVGHGLVPQIELATALGCATRPLPDGTSAVALDGLQETSVRGLWAAGETGGVGGAQLARSEGELAGLAAAARLYGRPVREERVRELQRRRDRMRAFADAMALSHAPAAGWTSWLTDGTEVCRCEEVTAGRIREAVTDLGARDARTVKLLTRAGMGWCQGRMCGAAVACLAARGGAVEPPVERRPFAVPVPLSALASLDEPTGVRTDSAPGVGD